VPGIEPDVVMVAASGNERGTVTQPHDEIEAEYTLIERQRAIDIGDLQVNVADAGTRRRLVTHRNDYDGESR
jgi:hypothetical protein